MKKYRTKSEWLSLIQEQEISGLSISLFSRQKGIHPNLFYKKRREFYSVKETQSFIELKPLVPHTPKNSPELKITIGEIEIYPGPERDMEFLGPLIKTAKEISSASV